MKRLFIIISVFASAAVLFSACSKDDAAPVAKVKIIHAVPNVPDALAALPSAQRVSDVNIIAFKAGSTTDSSIITSLLPYPRASVYASVPAGSYDIRVRPRFLNANVIAVNGVAVNSNAAYTVIAFDSVTKIKPMLLEDNLAVPAMGNAKVRFLHLSPNAPAVDIVDKSNNNKLFSNRTFADNVAAASKADFAEVPAGKYTLEVRLAGTTTVVTTITDLILERGAIYTVWATGFAGASSPRQLQVLVDQNR